jgi:2-dehydro-3-deoxyphosphogluconate aldolase / (4S)-4-hydroxy-2-oxoglutarate aldolase
MTETRVTAQKDLTETPKLVVHSSQFEYPVAATLTREEICACIEDTGVLPSLNIASIEDALFVAETLVEAGIPIVEISMNEPEALEIIPYLVEHAPTVIVGAGSIRNAETAHKCLDAGAKFLSTDGLVTGVVEFAVKEKIATVAGALTLTEVIAAWDSGSDFVKVVPCYAVGGPKYIQTLKNAIPQARLIAAGGVNQITALNYAKAGVAALSVSNELAPAEAIYSRQTRRIQELARRFLATVDSGRA